MLPDTSARVLVTTSMNYAAATQLGHAELREGLVEVVHERIPLRVGVEPTTGPHAVSWLHDASNWPVCLGRY
jgi:hypothetical protein